MGLRGWPRTWYVRHQAGSTPAFSSGIWSESRIWLWYNRCMKCEWCHREILGHGKKFCGLSCANYANGAMRSKRAMESRKKVCLECDGVFVYSSGELRQRFCSRSCAAKHNNRQRGNKSLKECAGRECNVMVQDRKGVLYCSATCRRADRLLRWKAGEWHPDSLEFPRWIRETIVVDGCSKCGWNETNPYSGKSACQINHLNGGPYDHSYDNIEVLCPNCHSLTATFGALNKGSGRHLRYASVV